MINPFKRRKEEEHEIVAHEIPFSTMARWFIYDAHLAEEVPDLAVKIGLTPISEEGEEKEIQDSARRLEAVANLYPLIESIAEVAARSLTVLNLELVADQIAGLDEEEQEEQQIKFHSTFKAVAAASILGALTIGLDLGMIESSTMSSRLEQIVKEEDYE